MKIVCFSFTEKGNELGEKIKSLKSPNYNFEHLRNKSIEGGVKSLVEKSFRAYDGIVFISATGIATRYIAPFIRDKKTDPAIIVIDDLGRFVISLLSGHLGGANELTNYLAGELKSIPVVTTATDGRGIEAVDIYAKRRGYHMVDMTDVKNVTSLMVDGKKIGIYSSYDEDINYKNIVRLEDLNKIEEDIKGLIIVSNKKLKLDLDIAYTVLVPRDINIGIGCKRGVETERILRAIYDSLDGENLYRESLREMGTVEVKKDEAGILEASEILKLPLRIFTIEELSQVEDRFEGSDFVKSTIGVSCVSEPAAYLLGKNMLLLKSTHKGITISISEGGYNE